MPSSLRKYSRETRDRAVRMYRGRCQDVPGEASVAAQRRVSELLDVSPATLRGWAERAEGLGHQAGTTTETAAELAALRRENVELRRANENPEDRFGSSRSVGCSASTTFRSPRAPTTPTGSADLGRRLGPHGANAVLDTHLQGQPQRLRHPQAVGGDRPAWNTTWAVTR